MPRDQDLTEGRDIRHAGWTDLEARAHLHVLELMVQRLYMQLANRTNDPGHFIEQTLGVILKDIEAFRSPRGTTDEEAADIRGHMRRHAEDLFHGIRPRR